MVVEYTVPPHEHASRDSETFKRPRTESDWFAKISSQHFGVPSQPLGNRKSMASGVHAQALKQVFLREDSDSGRTARISVQTQRLFPPKLVIGNYAWSTYGYDKEATSAELRPRKGYPG